MGNGARRPKAVAAATSTGDLEATILADLTLAVLDGGDGYTARALHGLEEVCARARTNYPTAASHLATMHYPLLLAWSAGRTTLRPRSPME